MTKCSGGDRSSTRAEAELPSYMFGGSMAAESPDILSPESRVAPETERLAYSVQEAADLLGVDYFSVYRLIQRKKLRACRALRGKLLVPRSELLRLLNS